MFKREPLHDEPISDQLRELRERGDGFRLPDNYLSELRERLPADSEAATPRVRSLFRRTSWLAVAASVALLLTLGWVWLYQSGKASTTAVAEPVAVNLDALSEEDILAYVEENIGEFELSLLYENQAEEMSSGIDEFSGGLSDEDLDALYYELMEEE